MYRAPHHVAALRRVLFREWSRIATASSDGTARIWNSDGEHLATLICLGGGATIKNNQWTRAHPDTLPHLTYRIPTDNGWQIVPAEWFGPIPEMNKRPEVSHAA